MGGFKRGYYYTRYINDVYEEEFTETDTAAEIAYMVYEKAIDDKEADESEAYHFDLDSIDIETIK